MPKMRWNTDATVIKRIKRANTDWWIREKAIVGDNGMTYIVYTTDTGEIHIRETDCRAPREPDRDFCLSRLNHDYSDEHNAPSLCILPDGRMIVAYAGHAAHGLSMRISSRPYDVYSFAPERTLDFDGSVTYAQMFYNAARGEVWLFCRVDRVTWQFRASRDGGETFSAPRTFIRSGAGGLYYADIRRRLTARSDTVSESYVFALYGHPVKSSDHTIRTGVITQDGVFCRMDGTPLGVGLFEDNGLLDASALDVAYSAPEGKTVRLLSVAPTVPARIALAAFEYPGSTSADYRVATWRGGAWRVSEVIAPSGAFLADFDSDGAPVHDGSETYVGGMEFYWGVGAPAFRRDTPAFTDSDAVYLIRRCNDGTWVLERYTSCDRGKTYRFEYTVYTARRGMKLWRPVVPVWAQDNMPVYCHEGEYVAYKGGWHCDVIMPVEPEI